jgi:hypothetical protein
MKLLIIFVLLAMTLSSFANAQKAPKYNTAAEAVYRAKSKMCVIANAQSAVESDLTSS